MVRRKNISSLLVICVCVFIFGLVIVCMEIDRSSRTRSHTHRDDIAGEHLQHPYLLCIVIMSAKENHAARNAIRQTWLSYMTNEQVYLYRFIIGSKNLNPDETDNLTAEGRDMLLLPELTNRYDSLAGRLLLAIRKLSNELGRVTFFMKVDDDTFVNSPLFLPELKALSMTQEAGLIYWGYIAGDAKLRHSGQWMEHKWILCDRYLPYARGGGYVVGGRLVRFIVENYDLLETYASEDVSLGAWLAGLKVHFKHDVRFDTEYRSRGCSNRFLVTHKRTPADMREMFARAEAEEGRICEREVVWRKSYIYDWSMPPSQCCIRNLTKI